MSSSKIASPSTQPSALQDAGPVGLGLQRATLAFQPTDGGVGATAAWPWPAVPYVAFSDDDSWWAPGALGAAADLFGAHPRRAAQRSWASEDSAAPPRWLAGLWPILPPDPPSPTLSVTCGGSGTSGFP